MQSRGFTLIELMIFTTIFSLFIFGFFSITYSFYERDMKLFNEIQYEYEHLS